MPIEASILRSITSSGVVSSEARLIFDYVRTVAYRWDGDKLSGVSRLLRELGIEPGKLKSDRIRVETLIHALEDWPLLIIQTQWQAYSRVEKRVVLRGMHRFPHDENRRPISWVHHNGELIRAETRIIRFMSPDSESALVREHLSNQRLLRGVVEASSESVAENDRLWAGLADANSKS